MNYKKHRFSGKEIFGYVFMIVVAILLLISSGNITADNNSTFNSSINTTINKSNMTLPDEVNKTVKDYDNESQADLTDPGFKIDVVILNQSTVNYDVNETIFFDVNITLNDIKIYSINSFVRIYLPDNTSLNITRTNFTEKFRFSPEYEGEYTINAESVFMNMTYNDSKSFYAKIMPAQNNTYYIENNSLNKTKNNLSAQNITEEIINVTKNSSANISSTINQTNNDSLPNLKDEPDQNISESISEISKNKTMNIYHDGEYNFSIEFADQYFYEHGPIIITGNASSYLESRYYPKDVKISMYTLDNPKKKTVCNILVNGTNQFYCEMKSSLIELTDYVVEIEAEHDGKKIYFEDYFELKLFEEKKINLEILLSQKVESAEKQEIYVNATKDEKTLSEALVGIQITDPDGVVYSLSSEEVRDGLYKAEFFGLVPGKHNVKATFVRGSEFKTEKSSFIIIRPDVNITMEIPDKIYHYSGQLDIKGILNISHSGEPISGDVSLSIYSEDTLKNTCLTYCEGACEFNCTLKNHIEFTNYRIYATLLYDLLEFSTYEEFEVLFRKVKVDLDINRKENYSLNEPQEYIITAKDDVTENNIEGANIYVEIIDPYDTTYRILPSPLGNGKYSFEFIGVISGNYSAKLTFIKDAIFYSENFSFYVSDEEYVPLHERNVSLIQLPAKVGEDVKWIREVFADNMTRNVVIHKETKNLKINNLVDHDIRILAGNKNITYSELETFNELRLLEKRMESYEVLKKEAGIIEKMGINRQIESLALEASRLKGRYDINISHDPVLDLSGLEGYNVISYETPAPNKQEKNISDMKKEVTIYSELHYRDVLVSTSVTETYKDKIRLYWIKDGERELFRDVKYIDENKNGLVDNIEWVVPHLSNQTFEVEIVIEDERFSIPELSSVMQHDLARFVARPNWPEIDNHSDYFCTFVWDGVSYDMIYDNGNYEYYLEFDEIGEYDYKIMCGNQVKNGTLEILRSIDVPSRRSRFSKTYFFDDQFYVTDSFLFPMHYMDDGIWKNIDSEFIASEEGYSIKRGELEIRIKRDTDSAYLSEIIKDNKTILSKPLSVAYYDISNDNHTVLLEKNPDNSINVERIGNRIIFHDYFDMIDLEFEYRNDKIKQNLIISPEAIKIMPNPAAFSMDQARTMVVLISDINSYDLDIPETDGFSNEEIMLEGRISGELFLDKDYYHAPGDKDDIEMMQRMIFTEQERSLIFSGISFSDMKMHESTGIVFDPSFSITDTGSDAMSVNNDIRIDYYDSDSPYLFFGDYQGDTYQAGLRFNLNIPKNATIVSAYLTLVPGINMTGGSFTANILVQDTDDAALFSDGSGSIATFASYFPDTISWEIDTWSIDFNYSTPDISELVQVIVNKSGWEKGNHIGFMIDSGNASDSYRSFEDLSTPDGDPAILTVVYRAEESRPKIMLEHPVNNTYNDESHVQFNFSVYDDEGIDSCILYLNSTGSWKANQSLFDVANNAMNNFSEIELNDGKYIWNVWCNDSMGNENYNLTDFELIVDTQGPDIKINEPLDGWEIALFDINFSFTPKDEFSPNVSCDFYIDDILNVSSIVLNSSQQHDEIISNISNGYHNFSAYCTDYAGNSAWSATHNFSVSRFTNLSIWDQADIYSNVSLFEGALFYANYTDKDGLPIKNASCLISFNSTDNDFMSYDDSSGVYSILRSMNTSGYNAYIVNCVHPLYDSSAADDQIYIYPKTNASIRKRITMIAPRKYNISIGYRNMANYSGYVEVIDYINRFFNTTFTIMPTSSRNIDGDFFGMVYSWRFFLDPSAGGEVNYIVEANSSYYRAMELYTVGFEASDS